MARIWRSLSALVLGAFVVHAQVDLGVPGGWAGTDDTSTDAAQREQTAQTGINLMLTTLDTSTGLFDGLYWQSANAWSAIANYDYIAKSRVYYTNVLDALTTNYNNYPNGDQYGYNDDAQWWGTAAYYAYRAYGDQAFLNMAIATWNDVIRYQITSAQASSGSNPLKPGVSISSTCNGQTMAGGVFWDTATSDGSVNAITTGLFVALSSYLTEATGNSSYASYAVPAAQWIENQVYDTTRHIVYDTVQADGCSTNGYVFTYNSGKYIEGLAVLQNVTGDSTWTNLMYELMQGAVQQGPWQGSNGIITEGVSPGSANDDVGFKSVLIRGIHEANTRQPGYSALQILVHSYNDVQYTSLLTNAFNSTYGSYATSWPGPKEPFTAWGQLAALDVLVSVIDTNSP